MSELADTQKERTKLKLTHAITHTDGLFTIWSNDRESDFVHYTGYNNCCCHKLLFLPK